MILTHLVVLSFLNGAGQAVIEDDPPMVDLSTPIYTDASLSTPIYSGVDLDTPVEV